MITFVHSLFREAVKIVVCKMSSPSLSFPLSLSLYLFFFICLSTRHRTVPDAALPLVRLPVQFCNFLTVSDCRAMCCQRVEVASYGMSFKKKSSERRNETCLRGAMYFGSFAACELLQFSNTCKEKPMESETCYVHSALLQIPLA